MATIYWPQKKPNFLYGICNRVTLIHTRITAEIRNFYLPSYTDVTFNASLYLLKDTSTMASTASSFFYPCFNTHDKFKMQLTPSSWMLRYNTSIAHFCSQIMASFRCMKTTQNDTSRLSCPQNDPIGWEPTISLTSVYGMKTNSASLAHRE